MKKVLLIIVVLFFVAHQCDKKWQEDSNNMGDQTEEKYCKRCYKDLNNNSNRIYSNGGYYCLLCWKKTQREIKAELEAEGY